MFWLMKIISNTLFICVGMIPLNYHRKKINFSKSYIITPNHQSFLDAAVIYTSIPHVFKTLGKKELEKTPIYGVIYKTVVITVDRSSMTARAASFRKMKSELDMGNSIVIFPEGTFSDQPQLNLLPFQDGSFSLALMQQVDVLPVLFIDSAQRLHPSNLLRFTPGWNRSVYLPPIASNRFTKNDVAHFKQYTQNYMQDCLNYIRSHDLDSVWDFAVTWQKNNPLDS